MLGVSLPIIGSKCQVITPDTAEIEKLINKRMDKIDIKRKYWIELWEDLISNFLKGSFGLTLYNPHILIDDIISEIEDNSFKNPDNRKFFYNKVTYYLENDIIVKNKLKSQFKLLRQIFNTERINYILEASKEIKYLFQQGLYFDTSLELVLELLTTEEESKPDFVYSLDYLTQGLIVELIKKGYSIEDIKVFLKNIFDDYHIYDKNILQTKFPHEYDFEAYLNPNGAYDRERFNRDVVGYISNLSIKDRIQKLSYYYYKKKEKVHYIFLIEGFKGEVEVNVADVSFYSLNVKRYVKTLMDNIDFEDLQRYDKNERYIQAAVEVNILMPKSSLSDALTKLENALDLISCYFNLRTDLNIDSSNYIIVKEEKLIFSSLGSKKRESSKKHFKSLDLLEQKIHLEKLNKHYFLWNNLNLNNKSVSKIKNALHWYKKGDQSLKQEDKMLNYWIALENLFNLDIDIKLDILNDTNKSKFHLIQEIILSVQIFDFIYDYGWELYHYYNDIVSFPIPYGIKLPEDLVLRANLNLPVGENIYLKNFIESLNEIKSFESNPFLIDKIDKVLSFYEDSSKAKKVIFGHIQEVKNDILMVYRFRNLIVHNAYYDNTLLPYFVWKIKDYSGKLIRKLVSSYSTEQNLSELLIRMHLKKEKFMFDFENGKVNLFDIEN